MTQAPGSPRVGAGAPLPFVAFARCAFHCADALESVRALAAGYLRHPQHPLHVELLARTGSTMSWFRIACTPAVLLFAVLVEIPPCVWVPLAPAGGSPLASQPHERKRRHCLRRDSGPVQRSQGQCARPAACCRAGWFPGTSSSSRGQASATPRSTPLVPSPDEGRDRGAQARQESRTRAPGPD